MESQELVQARLELSRFEEHASHPDGVRHLAEGLSLLTALASDAPDERERKVARNLVQTYSAKVESIVEALLRDVAQIPYEGIVHWFDVLDEFDTGDFDLPETFKAKKVAFFRAQFERLSPHQQNCFIDELSGKSKKR